MASLDRIKADIADLAQRPNAVRFEEIERIIDQLQRIGYEVSARQATHGKLFRVGKNQPFMAARPNSGDSHIRSVYVRVFLEAMITLGLFEDEQ
jgi:hypothetical protein